MKERMLVFAALVSKARGRHCCCPVYYQGLKTSVKDLKRLVILGTGWGGYSLFKSVDRNLFKVTVVSPRNHFLFTPLLASTTVGTLEFRSIIEPIRNAGFRDEHDFHLSKATSLDVTNHFVGCESTLDSSTYKLGYDYLVICVGAMPSTFGVPGVEEYTFFLKEITDARRIRNKILTNFELATQPNITEEERKRLLHFVIVGGGPTGVEFGAEFYDFLQEDLERLYPNEKNVVRVTLVESNKILSSFDNRLRSYAEKLISKRERMHIIKASVTVVTSEVIELDDGSQIPYGMVVWSTGNSPSDFVKKLDFERNDCGQIVVDEYLRPVSLKKGNVFALGDCTAMASQEIPCTAQVAAKQGRYLAKQLANICSARKHDPFIYKPLGMLAYVGGYKALTDTPFAKGQGFVSWILWRSAYTTKLGSWRLRLQVAIDWTKAFLFGRDTSKF